MKWESIDELLRTLCLLDRDGIESSKISKEISDRLRHGNSDERKLIARHSDQIITKLNGEAIMALKALDDAHGGDYVRQVRKEEGAACNFWDSS